MEDKNYINNREVNQQGAQNAVLAWALQILKLGQHVRQVLGQGTAGLWLLLRGSPMLLLNMRSEPTLDLQARACACTCASSGRDNQPHPAKQCVMGHAEPHYTAVLALEDRKQQCQGAKQPASCLGECTALGLKLQQALQR